MPSPLAPDAIADFQRALAAALGAPSGLDESALVDSLRVLEELVSTASAAQAALSVELDASLRAAAAAAGVPAEEQGRGIGHVVAHARRESPHRGQRHLGLARVTLAELPHSWAAWRSGRVSEWMVTIIARETACLTLEHRLLLDEQFAADADALEAMGPGELAGKLRAAADELDPEAAVERRRNAESERRLSLRPAPDTMAWLSALLPVKDGVAVLAALEQEAASARARGDERTRGQVMADTLVDRVTSLVAGGRAGGAVPDSDADSDAGSGARSSGFDPADNIHGDVSPGKVTPAGPGIQLGLVMSDHALFGGSDEPAHLAGFGPIPAELAREIVANALAKGEDLWLRRLYAHPESGELVQADSRARLFPRALGRLIRLRDQVCRTPWCQAPIRHVDHVTEHARGGATSIDNAQGLCESCNHAKQAHRWRTTAHPDGSVTTTHPTGHGHLTRPPRWSATVTTRDLPRLTVDFVLSA